MSMGYYKWIVIGALLATSLLSAQSQVSSENYVQTSTRISDSQMQTVTQYYDGLGRPTEKVESADTYYIYDYRGNCIWKKLPGCEPTFMRYTRNNRLAFLQDGNLRKQGDWEHHYSFFEGKHFRYYNIKNES